MALTESTMLPLGSKMPAFRLLNTVDDSMLDSASLADQPVLVMFFCNHCPYVIHLSEKIAELSAEWMERGVAVVGISSNDVEEYPADSPEKMKEEVTLRNYGFPYVYDETQEVAHSFTAALVYRGRFDATRPTRIKSGVYESDNPATGEDLAAAVESVLSNIPVAAKQLPSLGCNIKWKTGKQPS